MTTMNETAEQFVDRANRICRDIAGENVYGELRYWWMVDERGGVYYGDNRYGALAHVENWQSYTDEDIAREAREWLDAVERH